MNEGNEKKRKEGRTSAAPLNNHLRCPPCPPCRRQRRWWRRMHFNLTCSIKARFQQQIPLPLPLPLPLCPFPACSLSTCSAGELIKASVISRRVWSVGRDSMECVICAVHTTRPGQTRPDYPYPDCLLRSSLATSSNPQWIAHNLSTAATLTYEVVTGVVAREEEAVRPLSAHSSLSVRLA